MHIFKRKVGFSGILWRFSRPLALITESEYFQPVLLKYDMENLYRHGYAMGVFARHSCSIAMKLFEYDTEYFQVIYDKVVLKKIPSPSSQLLINW